MRSYHTLPLVAAVVLAACGSSADQDGDGAISNQEAAAAMESAIQPKPGQYRTSVEVVEFEIPGVAPEMRDQMRAMMTGQGQQTNTFCLTPEEAAKNGPQEMVKNMADANCSFQKFDVSGGNIKAEMQCSGDGGGVSKVSMDGKMTESSSDMTMTMDMEQGAQGKMHMKMRVKSERTGDCA
jgi:hypothetical protein